LRPLFVYPALPESPQGEDMNRLQKWFEAFVGICAAEQERLARAHAIFNAPAPDLSPLEKPACWRRSCAH
jgi:hypothetical protein